MNKFEPEKLGHHVPVTQDGQVVPYYPLPDHYGYPPYGVEEEGGFDPLKLLWYVIHYRWLIAALVVSGLVAGVMITLLQTPLYRATTKVEIVTNGAKVFQELEIVSQSSDMRTFETEREKVLSRDLARRVVFELNLTEDEKFLAPTPSFSLMNLVNRATGASRVAELEEITAEERERMAVEKIQDGLSVELLRNTSILSIAFAHADPEYAARVANQVARSYIDQNVDKTSETSDLARQFIQEQVRETKAKLQASEEALVQYAKEAGITVTGNDASLVAENILEINKALSEAIQERLAAERYYQQVQEGNAAALPEVFESESIQETKQKIAELKATYQEKLSTLKPDFPEMRRLRAQTNELQQQINFEIGAIARSVEIRYAQTQEKVEALRRELAELEDQQREFQDKNIQYTILKREVDSNRTQYDSLIAKLNEVGVGSELKTTNASIIDLAILPRDSYSPRLSINLALALAFFLALAAALVYILELMNNTFTVPDQIESELKLPVLGILPAVSEGEPLDQFADQQSALSEAYRSLRTSLQFTGMEDSTRTLFVTSSEQAEGKSTTVYKLAHDFAALGRKVLVIDADLRKPRQHRLFGTDNSMGLSNLLSNVVRQGEVSSIFHRTRNPLVTLLPAGTIPPNPVELLMSQKMAYALHHCAKIYDLIIVDGPPIAGLSDAPILSRQADATLLVVAAKQVTRKSVKTALSRLKAAGGNVVGAALNKFAIDKFDYNYSYRYMQYNYYGYGGEAAAELENHAPSSKQQSDFGRRLAGAFSAVLDRFRSHTAQRG